MAAAALTAGGGRLAPADAALSRLHPSAAITSAASKQHGIDHRNSWDNIAISSFLVATGHFKQTIQHALPQLAGGDRHTQHLAEAKAVNRETHDTRGRWIDPVVFQIRLPFAQSL